VRGFSHRSIGHKLLILFSTVAAFSVGLSFCTFWIGELFFRHSLADAYRQMLRDVGLGVLVLGFTLLVVYTLS
jgi:hypothetical protein